MALDAELVSVWLRGLDLVRGLRLWARVGLGSHGGQRGETEGGCAKRAAGEGGPTAHAALYQRLDERLDQRLDETGADHECEVVDLAEWAVSHKSGNGRTSRPRTYTA